jgi:hypothetical protein
MLSTRSPVPESTKMPRDAIPRIVPFRIVTSEPNTCTPNSVPRGRTRDRHARATDRPQDGEATQIEGDARRSDVDRASVRVREHEVAGQAVASGVRERDRIGAGGVERRLIELDDAIGGEGKARDEQQQSAPKRCPDTLGYGHVVSVSQTFVPICVSVPVPATAADGLFVITFSP